MSRSLSKLFGQDISVRLSENEDVELVVSPGDPRNPGRILAPEIAFESYIYEEGSGPLEYAARITMSIQAIRADESLPQSDLIDVVKTVTRCRFADSIPFDVQKDGKDLLKLHDVFEHGIGLYLAYPRDVESDNDPTYAVARDRDEKVWDPVDTYADVDEDSPLDISPGTIRGEEVVRSIRYQRGTFEQMCETVVRRAEERLVVEEGLTDPDKIKTVVSAALSEFTRNISDLSGKIVESEIAIEWQIHSIIQKSVETAFQNIHGERGDQ